MKEIKKHVHRLQDSTYELHESEIDGDLFFTIVDTLGLEEFPALNITELAQVLTLAASALAGPRVIGTRGQ